jgi:hypothetical protein
MAISMNRIRVFGIFIQILVAAICLGQIPNDFNYHYYKETYPKESFINLELRIVDEFDLGDSGLDITSSFYEKSLCLDENAIYRQKRTVGYSELFPVTNVDAKLYYPEKKKYKVERVKEFEDKAVIEGGVSFYADSREKSFTYENIREGAVTEIKVDRKAKDEYLVSGKKFYRNYITENYTYQIKCNKAIELGLYTMNISPDQIEKKQWEEGDYVFYEWKVKDNKKDKYIGNSEFSDYVLPQIIPYINSYTLNGQSEVVLNNTDGLYKWYRSLVSKVEKSNSQDIKDLAAQISSEHESELERVKATFQWVQNNIKYIAFSDGYGGFIPRNPDDIFQKRFGDCKDMSCLIIDILDEMDIEAHYTWVGTRQLPYSYNEVPSPMVDNHMIATYISSDGQPYFLDATHSNLKFGRAPYTIQDKETLIGLSEEEYEVYLVPIVPAETNTNFENIHLVVNKDRLLGEGTYTATGYHAQYVHDIYSRIDSKTEIDNFLESLLEKGSNKFELLSYDYNWDENDRDTLKINYRFNIDSYLNSVGDDIYLNMNLSHELKGYKLPQRQNMAEFFEFLYTADKEFILSIPQNYEVSYLPDTQSYEDDLMEYELSYKTEGNEVVYHLKFVQKQLQIEVSDLERWNEQIETFIKYLNNSIKLSKSTPDEE